MHVCSLNLGICGEDKQLRILVAFVIVEESRGRVSSMELSHHIGSMYNIYIYLNVADVYGKYR